MKHMRQHSTPLFPFLPDLGGWLLSGLSTELVKYRLQVIRESYIAVGKELPHIGPYNLTRNILKEYGVPGLFRGRYCHLHQRDARRHLFLLRLEAANTHHAWENKG